MQNLNGDIPKRQPVPIADSAEPGAHFGRSEEYVFRASCLRQTPSSREMIGMDVGIDDIQYLHPGRARGVEVLSDVAQRVDNRAASFAATAKEVGNRNGIRMQELPQDHLNLQQDSA
jgi:hypothetical protein